VKPYAIGAAVGDAKLHARIEYEGKWRIWNSQFDCEEARRKRAEAEVARLTAQGMELLGAWNRLDAVMGSWRRESYSCLACGKGCNSEYEPLCGEDCPVKKIRAALSTPAGSDEPLRRVRAEALRTYADQCRKLTSQDERVFVGDLCDDMDAVASAIERGEGDSQINKEDRT
jgi:hypothetical protein